MTDETREVRLAKNEEFFRSANETIKREGWRYPDFICECSRAGCIERVALTRPEYEEVRSDGRRFFVVPGHENLAVEIVLERHPTYFVVAKTGAAGNHADRHDPRDVA